MEKKKWFGRGVYGSKDVPIKILDKMIFGAIALVLVLVAVFAINGGYTISFETEGGTQIESQKLRHGKYVADPGVPEKAGYVFKEWVTSQDESLAETWDFAENTVEQDQTLYAVWEPAQITIKFDLAGGTYEGKDTMSEMQVTYGEAYGELPQPEKEGYTFGGWVYSGMYVTKESIVTMSGEHVLTAEWN